MNYNRLKDLETIDIAIAEIEKLRIERDSLSAQLAAAKEICSRPWLELNIHQKYAMLEALLSPTPPSPTLYCQTCGHGHAFGPRETVVLCICPICKTVETFGPKKPQNFSKLDKGVK